MNFSDIIGKLGSNHVWRYFWFLHWQKLHLQALATLLNFFLLVCKLCKSGLSFIHYILKISRYINIVYIGRYLVLTYIKIFFSTVCCFFSYTCWWVNCMSWVCNFNNFFLTCRETEARFIFEGFNIVLYGKFISDSPILSLLFYLVCKVFKGLFQLLCQSVSFITWVFES